MNCMKPASIAVLLACSLAVAGARAQPQQLPEPPAGNAAAAPAHAAPAPAPAPARKLIKRRSVQQVIEPTPRIVTDGYRPTLTVRPPAALPGPLPPPTRMNSCDAGGCFDTGGVRYNGGVGSTLLSPQGQLCTRGVVNAQCF